MSSVPPKSLHETLVAARTAMTARTTYLAGVEQIVTDIERAINDILKVADTTATVTVHRQTLTDAHLSFELTVNVRIPAALEHVPRLEMTVPASKATPLTTASTVDPLTDDDLPLDSRRRSATRSKRAPKKATTSIIDSAAPTTDHAVLDAATIAPDANDTTPAPAKSAESPAPEPTVPEPTVSHATNEPHAPAAAPHPFFDLPIPPHVLGAPSVTPVPPRPVPLPLPTPTPSRTVSTRTQDAAKDSRATDRATNNGRGWAADCPMVGSQFGQVMQARTPRALNPFATPHSVPLAVVAKVMATDFLHIHLLRLNKSRAQKDSELADIFGKDYQYTKAQLEERGASPQIVELLASAINEEAFQGRKIF